MGGGRAGHIGTILVGAAVLALLAGNLLGQPVLLGFVETGSMEPTIETGDGFVAIPSQVTGDPEPGDVVVFEAQEIQGGGLTTHRIVEETDAGYVTRGDANPFTDQDGDEPPVQDAQIVAVAWQVGDDVVTIPHLGTAVMGVGDALSGVQRWLGTTLGVPALGGSSGLAYVTLGISLLLFAVETVRERRNPALEPRRNRRVDRPATDSRLDDPRVLAAGFAALVVIAAAAAMIVPAGTTGYDVISAESPSERPDVIERGTTGEIPYPLVNGGVVPVVSYVDGGDRATVEEEPVALGPREGTETTVEVTAPAETGYYPTYVTEHRYLRILPMPVIDALYGVHPWLPTGAILALVGGVTYGGVRLALGPMPARARRRVGRSGYRSRARSRRRH